MPETKKEDKVNNIPEYGFIGAYFTDLSAEAFKDAKDERDHFFRFLDMLCLISIYQNENLPEEALDRVGTLLNDADLMMALEPHGKLNTRPVSAPVAKRTSLGHPGVCPLARRPGRRHNRPSASPCPCALRGHCLPAARLAQQLAAGEHSRDALHSPDRRR